MTPSTAICYLVTEDEWQLLQESNGDETYQKILTNIHKRPVHSEAERVLDIAMNAISKIINALNDFDGEDRDARIKQCYEIRDMLAKLRKLEIKEV